MADKITRSPLHPFTPSPPHPLTLSQSRGLGTILTLVAAVGLATAADARQAIGDPQPEPAVDPDAPRFVCEVTELDAGTVTDLYPITFEIPVRNAGRRPLRVYIFEGMPDEPTYRWHIPGGESQTLRYEVDRRGYGGALERALVLETTDPLRPHHTITLRAEVQLAVEHDGQPRVDFGDVRPDVPVTREVRFTHRGEDFRIEDISVDPRVTWRVTNHRATRGRPPHFFETTVEFTATADPKNYWGAMHASVYARVRDDGGRLITHRIPLMLAARFLPPMSCDPPYASFGHSEPGADHEMRLALISHMKQPLRILSTEVVPNTPGEDPLNVRVNVIEAEIGEEYEPGSEVGWMVIRVTAPQTPGSYGGRIALTTDMEDQPPLHIAYHLVVPRDLGGGRRQITIP